MGENLLSCYLFYVAYRALTYQYSSNEATGNVASEGVADGVGKVATEVTGISIFSFLCVETVQYPL